jgi:hypothetical protein
MRQFHRRIIKVLQKIDPDIAVKEVTQGRKGHIKLEVSVGGRSTVVTTAGSPSCQDIAMRNACREICKNLDLPYPVF